MDLSPYLTGILALILFTAFVKIVTVLNIVRVGLGLDGIGFGISIVAVALALALVTVSPEMKSLGGIDAFLSGGGPSRLSGFEEKMTPFLTRHADRGLVERLSGIAAEPEGGATVPNNGALLAAFLLTELKGAFELGLIILVPLLVIDLLVVHGLMLLGISQLSHIVVALPLKILLFFAVDGWGLIAEKLLKTYAGG
jgi:flagellar biosynthetic protein FliP